MKNKTLSNPRIRAAKVSAHPDVAFTAPIALQAQATNDAGESKGPRRFEMTAYTGAAMRLKGWQYPVVVDVRGIQGINKSRPILMDHDTTKLVGHTDKVEATAAGTLTASGVISGSGAVATEVCATADNGFPWQASIGAKVIKNEFIPEGQSAQVNGKSVDGPVNIARRTSLGEISFVALGADDDTSARIAANAAEGTPMNFEQWLEAKGFALDTITDTSREFLKAQFDAEQSTTKGKGKGKGKTPETVQASAGVDDEGGTITATADDTIKARREAEANEADRIGQIRTICAKASNPTMEVKADGKASNVSIEAYAIRQGWDVTKTELEVLRAERPTGGPYINTGAGSDITANAITAAVARSCGIPEKDAFAGLDDKTKEIAASKKLRGTTLHGAMFMIAASAGIHHRPGQVDDDFLRAMLRHDQQLAIQAHSGGYSTMSLSGITENILNKAMLAQFSAVASAVPDIAYETDTNDFKSFKRYRLTASGAFAPVGPTGELKNLSLQDESASNQVVTQGCVVNITRNILINDDMGALTEVPTLIGRQAAIAREIAVFAAIFANASSTQLGSASNFFSTINKNYISGASSALGISSLASARQKFIEQKDANGNPIMVMPDRLLVPPALETTADNLFKGANIVVGALGSTSSKTVEPNLNAHANKYRPIVTPFLGAQQPAGVGASGSDTAYYLLPNPAGGMAIVQVGYLRGQRAPIIERGEANFNTLGIAMRSFYDFGVAMHDPRCGVLSAGA